MEKRLDEARAEMEEVCCQEFLIFYKFRYFADFYLF